MLNWLKELWQCIQGKHKYVYLRSYAATEVLVICEVCTKIDYVESSKYTKELKDWKEAQAAKIGDSI